MRQFTCVKILEIRDQVVDPVQNQVEAAEQPMRVLPGMMFTEYPGAQYLRITKPPYIHLECSDILWIEVLPEVLTEFFEEVAY